jgi:cysteinyl-tRNA synthetase
MDIRLYNTLTHRAESFQPLTPGVVRMYHCGPTVYDYAHIGNFRAFVFADLLRRFFQAAGFQVQQAMNITDVGHMTEDQSADGAGRDKMELAADRMKQAKKQGQASVDNPDDPYQVAAFFTDAFLQDARALRMKLPGDDPRFMPHATRYVPRMIELIRTLIDRGHAYVAADGAVYYDVASFPDYGKLSGNTLSQLAEGAGGRVQPAHQIGKRNPRDFLLWKADSRHLMKWDSPWGPGYPGWHIECSAMAMTVLQTPTLDIHTGGEDNIFPHHECEIAQSHGATGQPFARFWLHVRFLLVEGEKMSKSRGNFFTVRDLLAKGVPPEVLRYELLRTHYRANMNFTLKGLEDCGKALARLREFAARHPDAPLSDGSSDVERRFLHALADDLNISAALGELFSWVNQTPSPTVADVAALRGVDRILDVLEPTHVAPASEGLSDDQLDEKCRLLDQARRTRQFAVADALRSEMVAAGIEVQSGPLGTRWKRKLKLT